MKKSYLILEDGSVFEGLQIGADGTTVGELVFTTGMTGYLETLTDPSYYGQIVIQTFPLIGNYGVIEEDFEGKTAVKGYIVREVCDTPSNFRNQYELDKFLKSQNICGLCGVDTRQLTKLIREQGVMNAMISDTVPEDLEVIKSYSVTDAVKNVSCKEIQVFPPEKNKIFSVVLIDYGAKKNIIRSLCKRGCEVTVVPHNTSGENILALYP